MQRYIESSLCPQRYYNLDQELLFFHEQDIPGIIHSATIQQLLPSGLRIYELRARVRSGIAMLCHCPKTVQASRFLTE